jgi:predicted DNA-binding protein (MmcQ/YjbR family)
MAKDIGEAVREICLSFPEAVEKPSHGSPDFRVRGKSFATYVVNHHGDGRIALWLRSPPGAQPLCVEADPDHFFVPPYVGPRGRAQKVLGQLRKVCLGLPETSEVMQFGSPVWRAGKKSFCGIHRYQGRLRISLWVGGEMQAALTLDPRYRIAPYTGHNGWIELDVEESVDWDEVKELVLISYRHFALKRMLQALGGGKR